ncbi:hypothetical protein PVAG01_00558 [Phlyctema vagabunda]|uniref:Uncharacterized protein n=1 Tax=Phlyctema vagabunda TaxID=108571 RepID=A0ABR4PUK0_9HELO
MLSGALLVLGGLASHALCSPTLVKEQTPSWTLEAFTRTCNDTSNICRYTFGVNKNDGRGASRCLYNIPGLDGASARTTDYHDVACSPGSRYSLNQGWDRRTSSLTLVVTDTSTNPKFYAFFGYTGAELINGRKVAPDRSKNAGPVGTFPKRDTSGWSVKNFTRDCSDVDFSCKYDFRIVDSTAPSNTGFACRVVDQSPDRRSVKQHSWSSQRCPSSPDWVISWGYNVQHNSAVMTIVQGSSRLVAWFGWDNVNPSFKLSDVGPNIVYPQ